MQLNKVSHIYTLARVAADLEDEDVLFDLIEEMEPEDGLIWVHGPGEEQCPAFTADGIEHLQTIRALRRGEPDPPKDTE
jgi:hypothetical protein